MPIAHGATGKGNDQVRFELGYYALKPDIKVIAPWREWDLTVARPSCSHYAETHQIPIAKDKRGEAPFSIDANLLHISSEGKVLEDPGGRAAEDMSAAAPSPPRRRPTSAEHRRASISSRATPSRINGERMSPAQLLTEAQPSWAASNGIGRLDLVENRFVGMASRAGGHETPGGTILLQARTAPWSRCAMEPRAVPALKDELMPRVRPPGLQRLLAEPGATACCKGPDRRERSSSVNGRSAPEAVTRAAVIVTGRCFADGFAVRCAPVDFRR
jgi:argininosuccinate synthase